MNVTIDLGEWPAWVQAIGSIAAIGLTAGIFLYQDRRDKKRIAVAGGQLAYHSMSYLSDRFDAALRSPVPFALRGDRTTEMIACMRELELSKFPQETADPFACVRSGAFSVNERISEVFKTDKKLENLGRRRDRLKSAGRVFSETLADLERLRRAAASYGYTLPQITLSTSLQEFMVESVQQLKDASDASAAHIDEA